MDQNINIVVILNNIRSSENVGSIFRTSDAALVSKIFLCGYTPTPLDRFGRENKKLSKAALGAEKYVKWEKVEDLKTATSNLKSENFKIVAVEQSKNSIDYRILKTKIQDSRSECLVLVFGNEVDGLSEEDIKLCDLAVEIPMLGHKESLNVSVAAGIILFEFVPSIQSSRR